MFCGWGICGGFVVFLWLGVGFNDCYRGVGETGI